MSDHASLLAFIDVLRGKGVKSYRGPFEEGTVEIEIGPALVPDPPSSEPEKPYCRCGHGPHEHNGYCLLGCEIEDCVELKEAAS